MDQESLIGQLMAGNEEFRRLRDQHRHYDEEIAALQGHSPLSAEEHWRITELKKLKLIAKDRMESILQHARVAASA